MVANHLDCAYRETVGWLDWNVVVADPNHQRLGLDWIFVFTNIRRLNALHLGTTQRVCVWTAFPLVVLSILGACSIINRFTSITGELFGLLIAMLFMQQAIKARLGFFVLKENLARSGTGTIVALPLSNSLTFTVLPFCFSSPRTSKMDSTWRFNSDDSKEDESLIIAKGCFKGFVCEDHGKNEQPRFISNYGDGIPVMVNRVSSPHHFCFNTSMSETTTLHPPTPFAKPFQNNLLWWRLRVMLMTILVHSNSGIGFHCDHDGCGCSFRW
ncbi:uncharacterized protein LOC110899217 isoform X1 [Helianthus annuus]|uniref:uncharacterized protein LOC110899217 isoform X1 n=1 Tax=Helianthus annuus TaxID=4232 RepID=UPI001653126A|nr:uncharacterized protein LOC110899217 isoform X1 [Helianthus annuus]XP_035837333.1 uncharacterized protein LOC110899217 isoform X1 [Helianthus annuus]XP_035837334.1 uncharacterized protein LOC110899217 isoform X1 [Helianthus annuus]XP_035837335.1 uncharacterized protein LOC110899217 isoform X1 [Helianthus annuus]XP_035837336.1 uncharacterized protein LOC110899217 isoform X1 [Helianthus annuus]XP_035837337.1 uncharacterized protein LOC110899217 isoform X1 [Helianthus annuus]